MQRHIPGRPNSPEPTQLVELAREILHPDVTKVGLTTTTKGEWALLLTVKQGTHVPIEEVEATCSKFPIFYQEESGNLPVARPAFPSKGE